MAEGSGMTTSERPTAVIRRVDLSAPESSASAARTSEAELLYGYAGHGLETRPCACGSYVHADPQRPALGVAAHNHSPRHQAWRLWRDES